MRLLILFVFLTIYQTKGQEILFEANYEEGSGPNVRSINTFGSRWSPTRFGDGNGFMRCGSNYEASTQSWFTEGGFTLEDGESVDISFDYRGAVSSNGGMWLTVAIADGFGINDVLRGSPSLFSGRMGKIDDWTRTTSTFTPNRGGRYYIRVIASAPRDFRGHVHFDNISVVRSQVLSTNDKEGLGEEFSFYPNPASSNITFTNPKQSGYAVRIYDTTGKEVMHKQIIDEVLDIDGLDSGMYLLKIIDTNHNSTIKYLIKN